MTADARRRPTGTTNFVDADLSACGQEHRSDRRARLKLTGAPDSSHGVSKPFRQTAPLRPVRRLRWLLVRCQVRARARLISYGSDAAGDSLSPRADSVVYVLRGGRRRVGRPWRLRRSASVLPRHDGSRARRCDDRACRLGGARCGADDRPGADDHSLAAVERWGRRIGPALRAILRLSDNIGAEALAVRLGDGSRRRGLRRAQRFAARIGARVRLRDGSGLATGNTATPRQLVRFLVAMRGVREHRVWERALPLAGRSGTLARRLRGTPAEARCRAKTGTLFLRTNASTLAGYCRTRSGRTVAFAMLMATTPTRGRVVQDRLLARIAAR
jgi:D-Ala-D-Ala carboxypeptidase 3 (S13) family